MAINALLGGNGSGVPAPGGGFTPRPPHIGGANDGGPNTQFPLNPGGVMTPGGGGTGAPPQGGQIPVDPPVGGVGNGGGMPMNGNFGPMAQHYAQMATQRFGAPMWGQFQSMNPNLGQEFGAYRNALMDWRQGGRVDQRPSFMDYFHFPQGFQGFGGGQQGFGGQQGGPVMTPGGGGTGAPPQGVGMVPGVPGSMATNPSNATGVMGMIPSTNPGQLPTY